MHGLFHGSFPGDVEIEAGHLAGVESHHVIGVRDATAGGKPAHGALNVLPVIIYTHVYTLIGIRGRKRATPFPFYII